MFFAHHRYASIVVLFFALRLAASLCMLKLSLEFKPASKYIWKELGSAIGNIEVQSILFPWPEATGLDICFITSRGLHAPKY